jgi:hypothetical protein
MKGFGVIVSLCSHASIWYWELQMVCMFLPVELVEYLSYGSSYDERLRATSEHQQSQSVTSSAAMSLVDHDQQIATLLRTMDEDDKRLILIAACIYTSSCTWLASEIRSLAGFTHADDSVADPQRIFEIVPWLLDISASSLDTILKRIVANGADKVIIEKLLHVTRHSTSSIAIILEDRMRKLDIMISQSLTRYKRQPYHIQPVPRASLLQLPLELFTMVIHSENLAFSDLRSLRQTCTELVHKCRDAFYNKIDSCTVSLLVSSGCANSI